MTLLAQRRQKVLDYLSKQDTSVLVFKKDRYTPGKFQHVFVPIETDPMDVVETVREMYRLSENCWSFSKEGDKAETGPGRMRSFVDMWRHYKDIRPDIDPFEVMEAIYDIRDELYGHYCFVVKRAVFELASWQHGFDSFRCQELGITFGAWKGISKMPPALTKALIHVNKTPVYKMNFNQESNYGFNMALLTGDYQYLTTPYMCKDYTNDIFWSEAVAKEATQYGLHWVPGRFDITAERFMLALDGGKVEMRSRAKEIESFINVFEKARGMALTKVLETDDDKAIVVDFSREWTTCTPMISTLHTLIRLAGVYSESTFAGNVMEYLKQLKKLDHPEYMNKDIGRLEAMLPKFKAFLSGKEVFFPYNQLSTMYNAHSMGVLGFTGYPKEEV